MTTILRRPGSSFPVHLPSQAHLPEEDRMVIWMKVHDAASFREVQEWGTKGDHFDVVRAVIGLGVERIDGLATPDGPWQLDREKSGLLTPGCCEWILEYAQEIVGLTMRMSTLDEVDLKNS